MQKLRMWLTDYLLRQKLSSEEKNKLVVHILTALQALPLSAIIDVNASGELTVSGRTLDMDAGRQLLSHARAALDNKALNLIREQVKYEAFVGATTKAVNANDMLFYRAALWFGQREEYFLNQLAQNQEQPEL